MIKRLIFPLMLALMLLPGLRSAAQEGTYFQYPIVPDSIQSLEARCNYLAEHFFDFCDLKKSFSNRKRMADEFRVYLTIIANARPDVAEANATALMKKLEKQPDDQLLLGEVAETTLYGDTAQMWIDGLYLPIARAVADNKRIDKAARARFEQQASILAGSLTGKRIASLPYTRPDGSQGNLDADTASVVVVFFNDPDCSDCHLARVRLNADISTSELISEGRLKVAAISLSEPDDPLWKKAAAEMPEGWSVGTNPDADLIVDLREGTPDFYILDGKHRIKFKHLTIDQVLDISRQLKRR